MSGESEHYDVIIVGGGPAGTSTAIRLATAGARVLLAERSLFPRQKLCGEFISPECLNHFSRLGVAERMLAAGGSLIAETRFYAPSGRGVLVPSAWLGGAGALALGLSRAEMDYHLLARARQAGADVREDARAVGLILEQGIVRGIHLKEGDRLHAYRAPVTIDATGRERALARHAAPSSLKRRAPLIAFKAHLEGAGGDERACEIYFYRGGYGGLSRVEGGLSNLCFIVSAQAVRETGGGAAEAMKRFVASNRRAAETLKAARVRSDWLAVALESFGPREIVPATGLLTVGDAASFIDPFTGSGMLMALESGAIAAEALVPWLADASPATFPLLAADYRARYRGRFAARLRFCSLLRRLAFSPATFVETAARALGASESLLRPLARATRENPRPARLPASDLRS